MSTVRDVMTPDPMTLPETATVVSAAREMKQRDIGDVIVLDDEQNVTGLVTDRDIVVRCVADLCDPKGMTVGEICSRDLVSLSPDDSIDAAVRAMRDYNIRRLPIVEGGKPIGIVSIGDLAMERDLDDTLADISAAPANN